ncbi:MAG: hypothetical protein U0269_14855 [Polyangiales bacterium]
MSSYQLRQPSLATFSDAMLAPSLLGALSSSNVESALVERAPGVFEFELFTEETCHRWLRELHAFEHHCRRNNLLPTRPNSMNAYGVVLSELGLEYAMDDQLARCVRPIAKAVLPEHHADTLDHQHSFVVEYSEDGDRSLALHVDDSEITLNVCLGWEFDGASVLFHGVRCDEHRGDPSSIEERFEWTPAPGRALIHAGSNRHVVSELRSGRRSNLIMWAKSSRRRRAHPEPHVGPLRACPRCPR